MFEKEAEEYRADCRLERNCTSRTKGDKMSKKQAEISAFYDLYKKEKGEKMYYKFKCENKDIDEYLKPYLNELDFN